jgi:DNA-binding transcriptional ArsR family regulator
MSVMTDADGEGATVDNTPLVALLGGGARVRILSAFVGDRDYDMTVSMIAEQAGVARSTVYEHIDDFLDLGVIEQTREAQGPMYQYNHDSEIAEKLWELDGVTLQRELDRRDDVER